MFAFLKNAAPPAAPEPPKVKKCPWCGKPAAPKEMLLMGFCSRFCMEDFYGS